MTKVIPELKARGLIHDITNEDKLEELLAGPSISFYCGFDPTADSLHVGSMLPLIMMRRLQDLGHKPIVLLGSATGMIGDPSGKSEERNLLTVEQIAHNLKGMAKQVRRFLSEEGPNAVEYVHNDQWISELSCIEYLRDVGKHFSVNAMMAKDSVKKRLEDREQGISYTEFSYMLLQAYDFYWLHQNKNCLLQVGGSDQWGNITAGVDLIRRKTQGGHGQAFAMTFPLLTTSSGTKFGKTEAGTVWLDAEKTSPYQFYQYWLNTEDNDVIKYVKIFTNISGAELSELEQALANSPEKRAAQKRLAETLTDLVHGKTETQNAISASKVLFGEKIENIDENSLLSIFADVPSTSISRAELDSGIPLLELLTTCTLSKSKGEARRLVDGGGVYINNEKTSDSKLTVTTKHLATEQLMVLRTGKKKYHLVQVKTN